MKNKMKIKGLLIIVIFGLISCGSDGGQGFLQKTPGVFVDEELTKPASQGRIDYLAVKFEETKKCLGFELGEFSELSVLIKPTFTFPCSNSNRQCLGETFPPNSIILGGTIQAWTHELIHWFQLVNLGDSDKDHVTDFWSCS